MADADHCCICTLKSGILNLVFLSSIPTIQSYELTWEHHPEFDIDLRRLSQCLTAPIKGAQEEYTREQPLTPCALMRSGSNHEWKAYANCDRYVGAPCMSEADTMFESLDANLSSSVPVLRPR